MSPLEREGNARPVDCGIQAEIMRSVDEAPVPEGLTLDQVRKACAIIQEWDERNDRSPLDLLNDLFRYLEDCRS